MWVFYYLMLGCFSVLDAVIIIYNGDENIEEFADSELPFTHPLTTYGIEGAIVSANPPDACTEISGPPHTNFSLNWIVLIAGNFCDYNTKVFHSEVAGYTAAVIYNLKSRDDGVYRHRHGRTSAISAVTVRTSSGLIIQENYLYTIDKRYRIFIFPTNPFNNISLFALVVGILLIITVSFLIIRFLRIRTARTFQNNCLSTQHLKQLQTFKFKTGDPYDMCAICIEDFRVKDILRVLPCLHGYHAKCIDPWLTNNRRICPICKQRVVLAGTFSGNVTASDLERAAETAPLLNNSNISYYRTLPDVGNVSSRHFHVNVAGNPVAQDVATTSSSDYSDPIGSRAVIREDQC